MATVDKNFKVKNGLVVEGTTGTINGENILTEASNGFIEDTAGALLANATKTNIAISYDSNTNQLTVSAENGIADSTTDQLVEGVNNLYYTNDRVKSVIDAAITNGTQTNIVVTYDDVTNTLSFTAENGVSDSTTDDLAEGTTHLYFTDQRAIDAVGGSATSNNDPNTVVKRDGFGYFAISQIDADNKLTAPDYRIGNAGKIADIDGNLTVEAWNSNDLNINVDNNINVTAQNGNIILNADGTAYITSATSGNEIATRGYADGLAVNYDPAGSATTAENNAKSYADGLAVNYDPAGSAANAETAAKSYADGLAVNYDSAGSASTAEQNANNYTDGEITTALTTAQGYATQALNDANAYTDNAVSGLAWKQSVNVLATTDVSLTGSTPLSIDSHTVSDGYRVLLTAQVADIEDGIYDMTITGGSYTLTRSSDSDTNDELIGASVYVMEGTQYGSTSWVQSNHYITGFAGQSWTQFSGQGTVTAGSGITVDGLEVSINRTTVDGWYDALGAADIAEGNANDYTDTVITTEVSNRNTAISTAIDALTTTDIEEGTNKYFTDTRAVDAIQAVVPQFTAVNVNSVAKNVAATVTVPTAGAVSAHLFSKADYRSAEYLVKVKNGSHTEVSKVLLTLDTSDNVAVTEYGIVGTNGSLATVSADVSSGNVRLRVTTLNDSSDIVVYGTLLV